jgi:hypothetical protein
LRLTSITYNATFAIYEEKAEFVTDNGMRRRTIEELRAAGAMRQKRWREKNRRTHRERVQELYGRSKAQGYFVGGVTPQEVARYALAVEAGEVDGFVTDNATLREQTHMGPVEGWDVIEEQRGGYGTIERKPTEDREGTTGVARDDTLGERVRRVTGADRGVGKGGSGIKPGDEARGGGRGQVDELGVGREDSGATGPEARTANEEATYRRLEELQGRQASGRLNAGVEVELDL